MSSEPTEGERIAAEIDFDTGCAPGTNRLLAAAIDKAVAKAREEGRDAVIDQVLIDGTKNNPEIAVGYSPENGFSFTPDQEPLREQLAAKEAEAAAMRGALEQIREISHGPWLRSDKPRNVAIWDVVVPALASNAGEAMLARLRAAEGIKTAAINWLRVCWADLSECEPTHSEIADAERQLRDALPADWIAALQAARGKEPV